MARLNLRFANEGLLNQWWEAETYVSGHCCFILSLVFSFILDNRKSSRQSLHVDGSADAHWTVFAL